MRAALVIALAAAVLGTGCQISDYCIGCGDDDDDDGDDAGPDAQPHDSGAPPDACVPVGAEVCNGQDDDCNGAVDDDPSMVGEICGVNEGQCTEGVYECNAGELHCTGNPASAEECDDVDNDCDGEIDDGNPEGGAPCGSDVGECQAGVTTCVDGALDCVGDIGTPTAGPESDCDGKDNDCDGHFDEGVPTMGACGSPDVGECDPGVMTCVGGDYLCVGGHGPSIELCDLAGLDQDCDGDPDNGFDDSFDTDFANCGGCQQSCAGTIDHGRPKCEGGQCVPASCDTDYHDDPMTPGPDCDYFCVFQGSQEACNNDDDDCDGDVDEDLVPPDICDDDGECAGAIVKCDATIGYYCDYGPTVTQDADHNIEPEDLCDGLDNDCDGLEDDSFPTLGDACSSGTDLGACADTGHIQCASDPTDPPECVIDDFGATDVGADEIECDGIDEDCDGNVDEHPENLQHWVNLGAGRSIMQYEVSRPDATPTTIGNNTSYACSRSGVQPWVFVTHDQAEAACATVGGRLCTEQEWHRACAAVAGTSWPQTEPSASNGAMFFEAEDNTRMVTATPLAPTYDGIIRAWVPDYVSQSTTITYSGISALRSSPGTSNGVTISAADARTQAPRIDFQITFLGTTAVNHYVWVRMFSGNGNDNSIHVGIGDDPTTNTPQQTISTANNNQWQWIRTAAVGVTGGTKYVSLYMAEDGVRVDRILVTRSNSTTAPTTTTTNGGDWSFASNPDTFVNTTCNGQENGNGAALVTGSKASCYGANVSGDVFDLSGNVKEWTAERTPGVNPIRGGAFNNVQGGTTCSNAFTLGSDTFFFNNVGFRCCK